MEKRCTKCGRVRLPSDFGGNRRTKDGLHVWCKDCVREYMRSERGRAAIRKGVERKRDEGYYRFGKGAIPILRQGAEKRGVGFDITAEELENWWAATPEICEYCGATIENFRKLRDLVLSYRGTSYEIVKFKRVFSSPKQAKIDSMTIDRRDNSRGYEVANLVKACWFCNYIKGSLLEYDDMKLIAERVIGRLIAHQVTLSA